MNDNETTLLELERWIRDSREGYVHDGFQLRGEGAERGVFATKAIEKGEKLIFLPTACSVGGHQLVTAETASPWLKCVARLYQVYDSSPKELHHAYLKSLPTEFESLLAWSDDQAKSYLSGTSLGELMEADREQSVTESQYKTMVRPFLKKLGIGLPVGDIKEMKLFIRASMCISTRGFHMSQKEKCASSSSSSSSVLYEGPFLLPMIDLLNHNPGKSCTTLQMNNSGFFMIAERNIEEGEEIFHSYGEDLTSAQVLQTFGFVPNESIDNAITNRIVNPTPCCLSKTHVLGAVESVALSESVRKRILAKRRDTEDEVWEVKTHDRDLSNIPDNLLIAATNPLTDELITLCCILLLPGEAYEEIFQDFTLLDSTALDDFFLGQMVCESIIVAANKKLESYKPIQFVEGTQVMMDDRSLLQSLLELEDSNAKRACFGLTVRLEEQACLCSLLQKTRHIQACLDAGLSVETPFSETPLRPRGVKRKGHH